MRTKEQVLNDLQSAKINMQEAVAELNAIEAASPKVVKVLPMGFKIAPKSGTLSIYGLQRFPVSLHPSQWLRVLDRAEDIKKFITDNDGKFIITQDKDGKPLAQPLTPAADESAPTAVQTTETVSADESAPTAVQTTETASADEVGDLEEVLGAG